jgi:D-serine deaminase-like pyridoxal phosphate-dependent protein
MQIIYFMTPVTAATSTATAQPTKAFEPSLFVWATVMSCSTEDRAILDAALKVKMKDDDHACRRTAI